MIANDANDCYWLLLMLMIATTAADATAKNNTKKIVMTRTDER